MSIIKKICSVLTSLSFMAFLFLVLIVSLAAATFVESNQGTAAARAFVYNAHWFEAIWILLAFNLLHNLKKIRVIANRKYASGIFHIAFLFMVLGAAVTRYFGYEGTMHIREGEKATNMLSTDNYFSVSFDGKEKTAKCYFSEIAPRLFSTRFRGNKHRIKIKSVGFIHNAEKRAIPNTNGKPIIDFVLATHNGGGMHPFSFEEGDSFELPGFSAGFNATGNKTINFFHKNRKLFMTSTVKLEETTMAVGEQMVFNPGDTIQVKPMFLYETGGFHFLVRKYLPNARVTAVKSPVETGVDAVLVRVTNGKDKQIISVFGHSGEIPDTTFVPLDGKMLKMAYGAKKIQLPFGIQLNDFQLQHYPGSMSPSSFASEVTVVDSAKKATKDFRIFMNNTLRYRGYKFFQSSYDSDEHGTILSVNHDFWGTCISYFGYALLFFGIIFSFLSKRSHFQQLIKKLNQAKVIILLFLFSGITHFTFAQNDSVKTISDIDKHLVQDFSKVWVQGVDGRIEPISTLSSELVRKVTGKPSFKGKSSDEVMLSMMTYPDYWRKELMIKVKDKTLAAKLDAKGKYISIKSLFDEQGNYKIANAVHAAYSKSPSTRNRLEKEYLYLDERVNICFMIFRGDFLHIFPNSEMKKTWALPGSEMSEVDGVDSVLVKSGFSIFLRSIATDNYQYATQELNAIKEFQQKYGNTVLPTKAQNKAERFYNKINPFKRIFPYYLLAGFALLIIFFANILLQSKVPHYLPHILIGAILLLFAIHTIGLIMRWHIAGHAPWSNGYESMVFVAWATMLAGITLGRKHSMIIGTAAFLSGIALFVAHLSWMNPEVTNLVPVLKSYWLTLHVAVITASYGFLGLSMFLGLLVMILFALQNNTNKTLILSYIERLTLVNELSTILGLGFLTMGSFLGAIWANESWGRYWGWDPKETWALITILVYAFVVHMRLIPSLKGIFNFNLATILAFSSVLMTYFGVNYYLSGLHSYGSDMAINISPVILISVLLFAVLIVIAFIKQKKQLKAED